MLLVKMFSIQHAAGHLVNDPFFIFFSSLSQRIDRTNFFFFFFFLLSGFKQNVWSSRINTASAFVRAIASAKSKPDVFINLSGVSAYRPSDTKIYTEDDKGEEYDFMSKLCLNWEQAAELPPSENVRLVRNYLFFILNSYFNQSCSKGTHSLWCRYWPQWWHDKISEATVLVWFGRSSWRRNSTVTMDPYR